MAEARRPQRHRRSVNHYSDDNPSTFTVKRKRGQSPSPPGTPVIDSAAQRRAARAEGRRHKPLSSLELPSRTRRADSSNGTHLVNGGGGGRGIKRKRRLKDRSSVEKAVSTPASPPQQRDEILAHSVTVQPVLPLNPTGERPCASQRYPQIYRDNYAGAQQAPAPADKWTRIVEAHKERWVPLQHAPGNSEGRESQPSSPKQQQDSLLALPAAPWTCFAVRTDDPLYFCVGDAAGNLLLYTSQTPSICIQTVSTSAAKREAERPILWSQMQKGVSYPNSVGSVCWHRNIVVVWTRQEVEILDVVQRTTLFCLPLDLMTASNHSKRQVFSFQSLDLHPNSSLLLWRPSGCRVLDEAAEGEDGVSLYCIDFSDRMAGAKRRVISPKQTKPDYFCHAAVWERNSQQDEILMVISLPEAKARDETDAADSSTLAYLCRMTLEGDILQQSQLPESSNVTARNAGIYTDCVLEQYGDYLFLCTGRGIRCYERNRLTFLTVYGETVALHNKTVGWQACFWIAEPTFDRDEIAAVPTKKKQALWIEREDELDRRSCDHRIQHSHSEKKLLRAESGGSQDTQPNANGTSSRQSSFSPAGGMQTPTNGCSMAASKLFSNMLLVGVPHPTRCPSELQSTLYVWKPGQVLPLTTLQAPPGGLLGLHIHETPTTGWRLTCATAKLGQGWQLGATLKSDFAGTMYPVGYKLLTDNTEYLEEEEELDQVVIFSPPHSERDSSPHRTATEEESELQLALRKSLETVKVSEETVSVLLGDGEIDECVLVPSIPDPSLREVFLEGDPSIRSPGRRFRSSPQVLVAFPQYKQSLAEAKSQHDESVKRRHQPQPTRTNAEERSKEAFKLKGKRSRNATVEHILQAAVDPYLKNQLGLRHKEWCDGDGSRFEPEAMTNGNNDSAKSTNGSNEALAFLLNASTVDSQTKPDALPWSATTETTTVTPSEQSPTSSSTVDEASKKPFCVACYGRMVIHTCGKRELPVDTEALERAEEERKRVEEEEKKRLRAEKRKLAEAKRREKRRIQKEKEDQERYKMRIEAERQQILEEQRQAALSQNQRLSEVVSPSFEQGSSAIATLASKNTIPKFSELNQTNGLSSSAHWPPSTQEIPQNHGFHTAPSVASAEIETYSQQPKTEPAAATPKNNPEADSTSQGREDSAMATDSDALAALIGLSHSLAPASAAPATEVNHYDYSGTSDRRSAILEQYSSHFTSGDRPTSTEPKPAEYDGKFYNMAYGSAGIGATSESAQKNPGVYGAERNDTYTNGGN
mmetsp:Transcript_9581/g.26480  ORF Transcript_9581/g.26480 Transcript_9581/m.26480 type:complete len:1268 (+) Transcript_9581:99-3902(+)